MDEVTITIDKTQAQFVFKILEPAAVIRPTWTKLYSDFSALPSGASNRQEDSPEFPAPRICSNELFWFYHSTASRKMGNYNCR
jgi:hypothetical protein